MNRMMHVVAAAALLLGAPVASAAQSLPDFTGIVAQNAPAVVHVEANYDGKHAQKSDQGDNAPRGMPPGMPEIFRRFFGNPDGPGGSMLSPDDLKHTSVGSGFIISSDGYILTNNHVVDDADTVTVRMQDRRTLTAKVIGTDESYDIALLKVDAKNLPTVTLGDSSQLKPGQWVLAIGSPFGFDYTVTQGIVSAVARSFGSRDQQDVPFIQTDVPINRGNSGGPLFNLDGQVVGINSQIYSNTGGYMGVSFSIPINIAMNAVQQIKEKGYVSRGMIGVTLEPVDADKAKALGLPRAAGALVNEVKPDSPGDKAGLVASDVILSYNGHAIDTVAQLPPLVAATKPGTTVPLKVFHAGKERSIEVTIGEFPRDKDAVASDHHPAKSKSHGPLGITVEPLSSDQREALDLDKGEGVVISHVDGRQAMQAGLRPGNVILMVGQKKIGDVDAFDAAMAHLKPGDTVMLLMRDARGNSGFVTLTVPKKGD